MAAVRNRDNKAEIKLRKALWRMGYRYRLQVGGIYGRPDIVLPRYRTVVFVDGDYWHGRALREGGETRLRDIIRGPRFEWWRSKLERNISRDHEVTKRLNYDGWLVIRVWESSVLLDTAEVAARIAKRLDRRLDRK